MKTKTKPPETKRCAIYTRKSTTMGLEQDFNTLDAQREAGENYVRLQSHQGWEVLPTRYDDGGFTGANTDRPALQRLFDDIDRGEVDVVVVYKVDRLSRSILDFSQMVQRFDSKGVAFVSVTQNFDTSSSMGRLVLNVLLSFAQFEREMTAERTRDKVHAARRKGRWTGGPVPLGYDLVDGKLVVNDLEAVTVREIFTLYLQHRSLFAVMAELKARGRLTKRYVTKAGTVRQADHWDKRAIIRTLKNPVYVGRMPCNGESFDGDHEPIVELETYEQANALIGGRTTRDPKPTNYLLKGLMRCGGCGAAMTPASSNRRGREYRYYRCKTRELRGKDACTTMPVAALAMENLVLNRIRDANVSGGMAREVEVALQARLKQERQAAMEEKRGVPGQLKRLRAEAEKLGASIVAAAKGQKAVLQGRLAEVGETIARHEAREAELDAKLAELDARKVEGEWLVEALRNFDRLWEVMTPENRQRLVGAVVDRITVSGGRNQLELDVKLADLGAVEMREAS